MRGTPKLHLCLVAVGSLAWVLAGCSVKVDKGKNGEDKDVRIQLPMGGLHVQHNATTAQDIGLPAYPGATARNDSDGSNSADVHLGFGDWQLHVRTAKYQTTDPETKVKAYYRAALARYGDVLECLKGAPTGDRSVTRDGLSCGDKYPDAKGVNLGGDDLATDLRAGSKRHQHIVGLGAASQGQTQFTLLAIDLPAGSGKADRQE